MYKTQDSSPDFNRYLSADVVVVGGGVAGVNAAVAAARQGLKTILVQNRPVLGGPSSTECGRGNGGYITGASEYVNRNARETGIMEELKNENAYLFNHGWRNNWSLLLRDFVEREPNATLLMNTEVFKVEMDGSRIRRLVARGIGSELFYHLDAPYYIDASGDAVVGYNAGAEFRMGREGKAEFGESMAPDEPDDKTMGNSIAFRAEDVGHPIPFTPPPWIYPINSDDDLPFRQHDNPQAGYWWLEYGGEIDTIADTEEIYKTLKSVLFGMWNHVKNGGDHGAANYAITWVAPICGKRESRRLIGDYLLSERDLHEHPDFPDAVAYGGWPVDIHPPEGVFGKGHPGGTPPFFFPGTYPIPFRSLYSKNVDNLLMAGRDISVTHVALGTTRVMATCGVCGQAVGTAVRLLRRYNCTPRELTEKHAAELRELLQRNDLTLPGRPVALAEDLVRSARISAGGSQKLEMQPVTASRSLVAPPKSTAIYDPCDIPPEDRRLGQAFPVSGDFIGTVRVMFNHSGTAPRRVTARLRYGFFDEDIAVAEAEVLPGLGVIASFRFDAAVKQGQLALVLDAVRELEVCTSSRYLPGVERKLDGCYIDVENFVFDVTPEQRPYEAANLCNDFGRPAPGRPNMWISDPAAGLPQTVELAWDAPAEFTELDLVFDTNLDRARLEEVAPECVKQYRLEALLDGKTVWSHEESDNFRRFRRHLTDGVVRANRLRVTVLETCGDVSARLVAIRAFR